MQKVELQNLVGGALQEKNAAMKNIKDYLDFELADYAAQFTIIS